MGQNQSGQFATAVAFSLFETLLELAQAVVQASMKRPGQREQTRVDGRTGLQLTNKASLLRRHGGNFIAWLLLFGALWAGASAARGADLPSKTGPPVFEPPPAAEFSWTGFYLGVHGGGGVDHFGFPFAILVPGRAASRRLGPSAASRPDLITSFRFSTSSPGLKSTTARPASEVRPP